jgi:uncharacterized lipoprotein YmbA
MLVRTTASLATAAALALAACGQSVSTSSFKGEQRDVAQAIANLQSNVTAGDERKVCHDDLAAALVARLNTAPGGCVQAVKGQLAEIDSYEVDVDSVTIGPAGRATARVRSIYSGKTVRSTVMLVKEGGRWKIAGVTA